MLLAYSWPMRVNTRSAPERSTRTAMPGYFASNVLAELLGELQVHRGVEGELALLLAASISAGVIASAGGAAARTGSANTVAAASAVEPLRSRGGRIS